MAHNFSKENASTIYGLFKWFEGFSLTYIYRGNFNPGLTDRILSLAETNMNLLGEASKTQKKVYFVMVESLQNITRHQDEDEKPENQAMFIIQNKDGKYGMASGNVIENSQIEDLQEKLDKINSLDQDQLKAYHKDVLENTGMSEKGGAGLGLIEIARKSKSKLSYCFKELNETKSFFYFKTKISSDDTSKLSTLGGVRELHDLCLTHHLNLIYQGFFTHDNLKNLLIMLEGSVNKGELAYKKKATNIMIELLQNICHHGANPEQKTNGIPGIIMVASNHDGFYVMSGNYIKNEFIDKLKSKIDKINGASLKELEDIYSEEIMKDEVPGQKGAGLGFIDIRLKGGNEIDYSIVDFNVNFSFLSVSVFVPF
ncbi:MAG: SiaB family protein kinase [Bacteroidia bacterium]